MNEGHVMALPEKGKRQKKQIQMVAVGSQQPQDPGLTLMPQSYIDRTLKAIQDHPWPSSTRSSLFLKQATEVGLRRTVTPEGLGLKF